MRTDYFFVAGLVICFILLANLALRTFVGQSKNDEIFAVRRSDPDMEAAFGQARATLDTFFALVNARRPTITSMAVKVGVSDGGEREYFWISPFTERDGRLFGTINNTPVVVRNVSLGQTIAFDKSEVVDWLYRENGKMFGNFTLCAMAKREPPEKAEALRREYGMTCEP